MYSLENLNALRVEHGKKPLKAWKESKAKLHEAVDNMRAIRNGVENLVKECLDTPTPEEALMPKATDFDEPTVSTHHLTLDDLNRGRKKPLVVKSPAVKGVKDDVPESDTLRYGNKRSKPKTIKAGSLKSTSEHAEPGTTVTLTQIAKELGMDPKVARAKMRRVTVDQTICAGSAHTFHAQHKEHIVTILKTDYRKR